MKQIIAIGGGGFQSEPPDLTLERYIIQQSGKERPRVCFLPHATGDPVLATMQYYAAYAQLDCRMTHMSLYKPPTADLESFLLDQDVIRVSGGNTKTMLATWREWHLDDILRKAWEQGVVLSGVSAGQICWFEQGLTDSIPGAYTALNCLGFLKGSCTPHFDSEKERRPTYLRLVARGEMMPGIATDDGAALHFRGDELWRIATSRPTAGAYAIARDGDTATETPMEVSYIGGTP